MATKAVITLTTDFGYSDAYVAAMKGVILDINPEAIIVDICHSIEPQNIPEAAFILSTAYGYFPQGTIHIVVVDPGVGSSRRAIMLVSPFAFFLAPDNGVLSYVIEENSSQVEEGFPQVRERELGPGLRAISLSNPRFWRHPVSSTFHGRDIFAPAAAHLSLGSAPEEFGEQFTSLLAFPLPHPQKDSEGTIVGHIIHIDHFGNLITDIREEDLPSGSLIIEISGQHIQGLSPSYQQGGELLAIMGSHGNLEIAQKGGSAAWRLNGKIGDRVKVKRS